MAALLAHGVPLHVNVISCVVLFTPVPASKCPSETGPGAWLADASMLIDPPVEVTVAPPVVVAIAVGFMLAWAVKPAMFNAPPVALLVLASESENSSADAVMLPLAMIFEDPPPSVIDVLGVP